MPRVVLPDLDAANRFRVGPFRALSSSLNGNASVIRMGSQ